MKKVASIAVLFWLAVVGWIVFQITTQHQQVFPYVNEAAGGNNALLQSELANIRAATAAAKDIAIRQQSAAEANAVLIPANDQKLMPAGMVVAGNSTATPGQLGGGEADLAAGTDAGKPAEHHVSFIYYSNGFQRAVVDGLYVRPGMQLPDGDQVSKITFDKVILVNRNKQILVLMPDAKFGRTGADSKGTN